MEYKVEFVPVSDIKPYENNVKKHDSQQISEIANSIKQFGFRQNIVIDGNNEIVIGHGRYEAAKELGMETVPCVRVDNLTPEQVKALRIADNKLADRGIWDNNALADELKEIGDVVDMTDFGFGDFELTVLKGDFEPEPYDSEETKEYDDKGEDFLAKKRVIITYTDDDAQKLTEILGLDEIKKVVYDISELLG